MSEPDAAAVIKGPVSNPSPLSLPDLQSVYAEIRSDLQRLLRRRTGDPEVAADLIQDLFLKLTAIRSTIPDRPQARAYLFRMASNLAIDHRRTEARRAEILKGSQVLFEDADADADPETVTITRDQLRRVELALSELPQKCREVLILARVQGLEHKEIARRLGVSVSLVEKYQLRALRHCRERLGGLF